ncbi:MAG: hypothetical protein EOM23_02905 [Candidatus Moranbacteria bacterium]|nr:hypothetical protein [Candidatus Moranbacteria bacterium]
MKTISTNRIIGLDGGGCLEFSETLCEENGGNLSIETHGWESTFEKNGQLLSLKPLELCRFSTFKNFGRRVWLLPVEYLFQLTTDDKGKKIWKHIPATRRVGLKSLIPFKRVDETFVDLEEGEASEYLVVGFEINVRYNNG